jgi:signal transduction histidine kinase|tara:strand:- start:113 stop:658 length:546 start_codon:yes stop_codon:yes gene_type:complete
MAEVEFAGVKFKGGKIFVIITALTTLGGGLWGGFEFYKDYLTMKEQIQEYVAPDLSGFDKDIAVMKEEMDSKTDLIQTEVEMLMSEMEMMMQEIRLVADVANELKNDLRQDVRRVEKIVNDVEQLVKEDSRETNQELRDTTKDIQEDMQLLSDKIQSAMTELEEKIDKRIKSALENPLSQM